MSDKNNVLPFVPKLESVTVTLLYNPAIEGFIFDKDVDPRLLNIIAGFVNREASASNRIQELTTRINVLNSENTALQVDRDRWRFWYKFMAFMVSIQFFIFVLGRELLK